MACHCGQRCCLFLRLRRRRESESQRSKPGNAKRLPAPKNLTVRLDDELAADTDALARAEGQSLNETVKLALREAVERRRQDPEFPRRVSQIIEQDRELLERLAK